MALSVWLGSLPFATQPALATACPNGSVAQHVRQHWLPSDGLIAGFRAPITLRRTGDVCSGTESSHGHADGWVGVESTDNQNGIVQIGWTHDAIAGFCRFLFWNDDNGHEIIIVFDRCDLDSGGTTRLYKVDKWFNPDDGYYYYGIWDCAETDWSTCSLRHAGPRALLLGDLRGVVDAEVNYSNSCTTVYMGSDTNPTRWGGTDPIKGEVNPSGTWGIKSLQYGVDNGDCSHYVAATHTDQEFRVYDDRN